MKNRLLKFIERRKLSKYDMSVYMDNVVSHSTLTRYLQDDKSLTNKSKIAIEKWVSRYLTEEGEFVNATN